MDTNNKEKLLYFNNLPQNGYTIVEYVWIGGLGDDIRSKSKTFNKEIKSVKDLPKWNYDGSSTYQAVTSESEIELYPVCLFDDPFRGKPNKIAICETYFTDGRPTLTNFRHFADKLFSEENVKKHEPWFGIEQEYVFIKYIGTELKWPLGWAPGEYLGSQGLYYCSNGSHVSYGRDIVEAHLKACLNAGVKIFGTNAEVFPSQWEFQVGTCNGIEIGDHLLMARFLLTRVAELFGASISFEPKLFKGWNGSGAHANYSNKGSREDKDMANIKKQIDNLSKYHNKFMELYGEGNKQRMDGNCESSKFDEFSFGEMNRAASVRIPKQTAKNGNGYYEDRRPSSNVDGYIVSSLIFSATCLDGKLIEEIYDHYTKFLAYKKESLQKSH